MSYYLYTVYLEVSNLTLLIYTCRYSWFCISNWI